MKFKEYSYKTFEELDTLLLHAEGTVYCVDYNSNSQTPPLEVEALKRSACTSTHH